MTNELGIQFVDIDTRPVMPPASLVLKVSSGGFFQRNGLTHTLQSAEQKDHPFVNQHQEILIWDSELLRETAAYLFHVHEILFTVCWANTQNKLPDVHFEPCKAPAKEPPWNTPSRQSLTSLSTKLYRRKSVVLFLYPIHLSNRLSYALLHFVTDFANVLIKSKGSQSCQIWPNTSTICAPTEKSSRTVKNKFEAETGDHPARGSTFFKDVTFLLMNPKYFSGSSQWTNGCVDNRSGFGEEDDSKTGEVGEKENLCWCSVYCEAQGET